MFLDSGAHHVAPAESWLQLSLNMTNPGGLQFVYSLSCDHTMAKFEISVDGHQQHLPLTCQDATGHDSRHVEKHIFLSRGPHTIRWIYARTGNPHHARGFGQFHPFSAHPPKGVQHGRHVGHGGRASGGLGAGVQGHGEQGLLPAGDPGVRDGRERGKKGEGEEEGAAHLNQHFPGEGLLHPGGAGGVEVDMARIYRFVIIDVDEGQGAATQVDTHTNTHTHTHTHTILESQPRCSSAWVNK